MRHGKRERVKIDSALVSAAMARLASLPSQTAGAASLRLVGRGVRSRASVASFVLTTSKSLLNGRLLLLRCVFTA